MSNEVTYASNSLEFLDSCYDDSPWPPTTEELLEDVKAGLQYAFKVYGKAFGTLAGTLAGIFSGVQTQLNAYAKVASPLGYTPPPQIKPLGNIGIGYPQLPPSTFVRYKKPKDTSREQLFAWGIHIKENRNHGPTQNQFRHGGRYRELRSKATTGNPSRF